MRVIKFKDEESWLEGRMGHITGTKAGKLVSKRDGSYLKGFYEVIAERVAIPPSGENVMDRGKRLEEEAIDRFVKETGKKVNKDLILISRDDNDKISYSPDGIIGKTEDVEVKCLNSASHIEAWLTKEVPSEYHAQVIQGFVVNDKLKKRHIVFYDPRMPVDFFFFTVTRETYKTEIKETLKVQMDILKEIDDIEKLLTF